MSRESRQVRILENGRYKDPGTISIDSIRPSPENGQLYRPVVADDPEIVKLAESIRSDGIREPLVLSADGWLLSGHRRHAAARLAGLAEVPCRIDATVSRQADLSQEKIDAAKISGLRQAVLAELRKFKA